MKENYWIREYTNCQIFLETFIVDIPTVWGKYVSTDLSQYLESDLWKQIYICNVLSNACSLWQFISSFWTSFSLGRNRKPNSQLQFLSTGQTYSYQIKASVFLLLVLPLSREGLFVPYNHHSVNILHFLFRYFQKYVWLFSSLY